MGVDDYGDDVLCSKWAFQKYDVTLFFISSLTIQAIEGSLCCAPYLGYQNDACDGIKRRRFWFQTEDRCGGRYCIEDNIPLPRDL